MIAIKELSPSYMTEMEANEVDSIFGGNLLEDFFGVPNPATSIVITPVGGTQTNVLTALNQAIGYAGLNGFVQTVLHGGSTGFLATQPAFFSFDDLPV